MVNYKLNPKRIMWESDKEIMYNMEDALISPTALAMLTGTEIATGSVIQVHKKQAIPKSAIDSATKQVTLEETPTSAEGYPMFVFHSVEGFDVGNEIDGSIEYDEGYSIAANVITFGNDTYDAINDYVIVDYYYDSEATADRIIIEAGNFPGYYKLEADTLWRRERDGLDLPAKFTMPRIKVASNFTIENASSGDPSTFNFEAEVFPAGANNQMVIIDIIA